MTNETPDKQGLEDPAANAPTPVVSKPPSKTPASPGVSKLAVLSLVVGGAALVAAGYLGLGEWQRRQVLLDALAQVSAVEQRADTQDQQLRQLQRGIDQLGSSREQIITPITTHLETLDGEVSSLQKRLHELSTTDRTDWKMAEAEYLMRLAGQRLLMGGDTAGSMALLQAADQVVAELDDTALFAVRAALADDIAKLRAAGKRDLEGVYLKLAAAAKQGESLRLFEMPAFKPQPPAETEQLAEGWRQRFQHGVLAAWEKLKSYIRFTHREQAYQPVLAPEYEAAVRQNLRLSFEQAQMAALAGNQALYQASLDKSRYWLETFFTLDPDATRALLATIQELQQQQIAINPPDISGSLRSLKDFLDRRHDAPSVPEPESAPAQEEQASPAATSGESAS